MKPAVLILILCASVFIQAGTVDPTRPIDHIKTTDSTSSLQLESILFSQSRKVAIINKAVVESGDYLGNIKVNRISEHSVEVEQDGETRVLRLPQTTVKKPATNQRQDY